jgi:hypothetical protein
MIMPRGHGSTNPRQLPMMMFESPSRRPQRDLQRNPACNAAGQKHSSIRCVTRRPRAESSNPKLFGGRLFENGHCCIWQDIATCRVFGSAENAALTPHIAAHCSQACQDPCLSKPNRSRDLEANIESKGGMVSDLRIVPIRWSPELNHYARHTLHHKRTANMEEVQSRTGPTY